MQDFHKGVRRKAFQVLCIHFLVFLERGVPQTRIRGIVDLGPQCGKHLRGSIVALFVGRHKIRLDNFKLFLVESRANHQLPRENHHVAEILRKAIDGKTRRPGTHGSGKPGTDKLESFVEIVRRNFRAAATSEHRAHHLVGGLILDIRHHLRVLEIHGEVYERERSIGNDIARDARGNLHAVILRVRRHILELGIFDILVRGGERIRRFRGGLHRSGLCSRSFGKRFRSRGTSHNRGYSTRQAKQ